MHKAVDAGVASGVLCVGVNNAVVHRCVKACKSPSVLKLQDQKKEIGLLWP